MIPVALIVMAVGTGLYATRGLPPGSEGNGLRVNAVILAWCAIFLGISFACFWGVWGPDANPGPGGKEGGLIVGFLFVLMGGGALPFLFSRRESRFGKQARDGADRGPGRRRAGREAATSSRGSSGRTGCGPRARSPRRSSRSSRRRFWAGGGG